MSLSNPNSSTFEDEATPESSSSLEQKLETLKSEKATLEAQYGALLGKLTTMRNTLGDKLRQDADELDRREQQICQFQTQNEELVSTIETLRSELIQSHEEAEHLRHELDQLRIKMMDSQRLMESESYDREEAYRETREEVERLRNQLEDSKIELLNETIKREQAETNLQSRETALSSMIRDIETLKADRDLQAESASNLQSVLEEFQSAKDAEIKSVVGESQNRLAETEKKLLLFQQKASDAEAKLAVNESNAEMCESLKKELKAKNLLIGKVRHEAVILNEHLTEALQRLRRDNTEYSVDRRLVTNVLLSFILTPREDTKRFEMLSLLASILSWNDEQRQQVGLQRSGSAIKGTDANTVRGSTQYRAEPDTLGDNDTITDQWVSFLLREANSASPASNKSLASLSLSSPVSSSHTLKSSPKLDKSPDITHLPSSPGSSLSTLSTITRAVSDSP
ncbi:hypothetical protein O181_074520 [Austropuccinia psidii MF-1]|uniref:GRIP domain-containing protein n=1 Tax=Austropuccinia psidii MF-1 TaxID=1389203 RepID=A0A9Q3ID28_9BASI|nr:hypothetical protein [Austropuccinia psidii MF-1]